MSEPNYGKLLAEEIGMLPDLSTAYNSKMWDKLVVLYEELRKLRASLTSATAPHKLNVADVSRILVERTNGILWKEDADGNMSRLTVALNELLTSATEGERDALEILKHCLPYYSAEDRDDFIYLARLPDLEKAAKLLSKRTAGVGAESRTKAIEFGGYLADAAEQYLKAVNDYEEAEAAEEGAGDVDLRSDCFRGLKNAIFEFRKRAARAESPSIECSGKFYDAGHPDLLICDTCGGIASHRRKPEGEIA